MNGISNLYIPVCGLFIAVLCNISFFSKKRAQNKETAIFARLLIYGLVDSIMMTAIIALAIWSKDSVFLMKFFNKVDYAMYILWASNFFLYVYYVTTKDNENGGAKLYKFFFFSTTIIDLIIILMIVLFKVVLHNDGVVMYSDGMSLTVSVLGAGIYVLAIVACLIINAKKVLSRKLTPLYVLIGLIGLVMILNQFDQTIVVISFILAYINLIMLFTIENPDMKMVQQLEVAREQADNANRAKTDFLSSMSHEIRTPLNAIVGFSDCITDATTLDEAKENAKDIVNASETLLEIVNGILDISKIESGKLEIVNSKYNAPETFLELAKLITPKMKEKGLEFTYSIAPDLPQTLFGDHANIKKVVTNLLSNACKYTERGFVHYEVNCVNSNGVSKLIISVEDSGRGIKKENVDKMFTKFQRLDEDRNTTIEGTGLGLAITKQLIELMGGRIILHTIYGEGSKFTVVLNQRIEKEEMQEVSHVKTTLDLKDVRILLVDDTSLNLKVAGKLMEKFNANSIDFCSSGFECIDKIRNGKIYDIIFLDDMMPKMSGVETLKKLKEDPNYKTPTIALTANAITGMKEKYLADGFNDYLAKPIDKNELIRVCNEVLGRTDVTSEMPKIREVSTHHKDSVYTEEQTTIIPVEEDVEKLLGNIVELGKNNVVSKVPIDDSVNDTNAKMVTPNRDVEILDLDTKKEEASKVDLVPVVDIDVPNVSTSSKYDVEYLKSNGCDMAHALELLGDMEMFNMTVHDFLEEIDNKWQRINDELNSGDMENYAIDVHSLKSDCKYLGFMGLADIAYDHELKSKDKQLDYCREHFPELEKEYIRVIEIIRNYAKDNPSE